MSKNNGMIVVWPVYIDSQKSRAEGRMDFQWKKTFKCSSEAKIWKSQR
jgi:signal recognition particle subunit SEC65